MSLSCIRDQCNLYSNSTDFLFFIFFILLNSFLHSSSIELGYTSRLKGVGLGTIEMKTIKYIHGILD